MTSQDFEFVCRLVRDRSAIVLEPGKEYLVEGRLTPIVKQLDLGSISGLIGRLRTEADSPLANRVVEAMVTTETSFFRDLHPFETLRTNILPELIQRRAREQSLNVWCAACSTGQEPYSIALLVREHFPDLTGWQVRILATDLSSEVLGRAKSGIYSQFEVNRGLPAALLVKYFRQTGSKWELDGNIRRMVEFRELNLTRPWPPLPRMDLIFLRNVMIYFDVETKKAVLARVAKLLRPDGYLLLGGAETTFQLCDAFRRSDSLKGGFHHVTGYPDTARGG